MKIKYANEFFQKLVMGDQTTCAYQYIYNENDSDGTNIIKYFIMHGLGLCIKVNSYVEHMFYALSFSHNTAITIAINNNTYFIYFNTNSTVFNWGSVNSNNNRT